MNYLYFVKFRDKPFARCLGHGMCRSDYKHIPKRGEKYAIITKEQNDELFGCDEPSKWIAETFDLPFQRFLPSTDIEPIQNVVEVIANEDSERVQCRFGNHIKYHAIYCHNDRWVDAPRKCHRSLEGENGSKRFADCPGFEPCGESKETSKV